MWKTVRVRSEDCFLRITDSEGNYEFFLTNLKCIWKNKQTECEIVAQIHELNPLIEAELPKDLVNKAVTSLYERNSTDEIDFTEEGCGMTLKSVSTIGGFPFKFDLKLELVHHDNVFNELTLPLVLMVHILKEREDKLIGMIKLKDREIEDYRLGGAQLSHKILKTKPFDEKEHLKGTHDSKKICEVIQSPVNYFSSSLNELYEHTTKEITKYSVNEGPSDGVQLNFPQHSPDMFDESDEPEAKVKALPKKVPTLLKIELKPKRPMSKKSCKPTKKLQI